MLEFALKQERAKYNKLKYGSSAPGGGGGPGDAANADKPNLDEEGMELPPLDAGSDNYIAVSNVNWRQGRQLLRQYLQEIGYTDTIIDVRSNRIRSLLGLHDQIVSAGGGGGGGGGVNATGRGSGVGGGGENEDNRGHVLNGGEPRVGSNKRAGAGGQGQQSSGGGGGGGQIGGTALAEEMMIDTEAAVMANFDFLSSEVRRIQKFHFCLGYTFMSFNSG